VVLGALVSSTVLLRQDANAATTTKVWGAAELDFWVYICSATGKFCPEMTKVEISPARKVDRELAEALHSIPRQVFVEMTGRKVQELDASVDSDRELVLSLFQKRVSFDPSDLTDQYSLDFDSYLVWKSLARILPSNEERRVFQRQVAKRMLEQLTRQGASAVFYNSVEEGPEKAFQGCSSLLALLKSTGFLEASNVEVGDFDVKYWKSDSPPTTLTVTIDKPVTLQANLQLGGEGTGFKPDVIENMLAVYLESCGMLVDWVSYFIDPTYRPNPDDYQPSQVLCQINVRPRPT